MGIKKLYTNIHLKDGLASKLVTQTCGRAGSADVINTCLIRIAAMRHTRTSM